MLHRVIRPPHPQDFVCLEVGRMSDGTTVTTFAHTYTERLIHLGDDGCAFTPMATGRYRVADLACAVERVLPNRWQWLEMGGYVAHDVGPEPWPEEEHPGWLEADIAGIPFDGDLAF